MSKTRSDHLKLISMQMMTLKRVHRYLLKTSDKVTILCSALIITIDRYVDVDFAGLKNREDLDNKNCFKSRTEYIY